MDALGQISSAALQQYLAHGNSRGLDIEAALGAASLSAEQIEKPEARLAGSAFQTLLHHLIEQSGDPLFGLHTSEFVQPGSYNVMGYIAMSASTLLEALSRVHLYERLVGDMGTTQVLLEATPTAIRWDCRYQDQPARQHLIDNVLGSWMRYARWLTGNEQLAPSEVWLEHPAPPAALVEEYQRVFLCPVRFGQPFSALIGPAELLQHPIRQPDPLLLSTLEDHARRQLDQLGVATSLSERVRRCIAESLGEQLPRKENIAERLGMNVRTLHRRLADEENSWQGLLDEVRLNQARQLLQQTQDPQAHIAQALGYSDIRSFQRSFKRHTGMTPGQFRSQHPRKP